MNVVGPCQPCQDTYHGDCVMYTLVRGIPDWCSCGVEKHITEITWPLLGKTRVPEPVYEPAPSRAEWTADEINDHEHDLGIGPWETKYDDLEWERRDQEERTSVPYEIGGE